jgi:hypothetical protein
MTSAHIPADDVPMYSSEDEEIAAVLASGSDSRRRGNSATAYASAIDESQSQGQSQNRSVPAVSRPSRSVVYVVIFVMLVVIIALSASGGFAVGSTMMHNSLGVTTAVAHTALYSNTSVAPCTDLYTFACGGYEAHHTKYSNIVDFQHFLDTKTDAVLRDETFPFAKAGIFYDKCLAYVDAYQGEQFAVDAMWLWQRGYDHGNVSVGRTVNPLDNTESLVYVANGSYFDHYHDSPLPLYVALGDDDCGDHLVQFARKVVDNNRFTSVIVYADRLDDICGFVMDWLHSEASVDGSGSVQENRSIVIDSLFQSQRDCLRTTVSLWPGAVSWIAETLDVDRPANVYMQALCEEIKGVFSTLLQSGGHDGAATKVAAVVCSTKSGADLQVYDTPMNNIAVPDFPYLVSNLLRERYNMGVTLTSVGRGDFSMSALDVNAVYSSVSNTLFITPAMSMFSAESSERRAFVLSRVGFVLAHELAHSIDIHGIYFDAAGKYVPASVLGSLDAVRVYNQSTACIATEFGTRRTLQEDVADHMAMGVVNHMMLLEPPTMSLRICSPVCVTLSSLQQFYVHFAQTWCTSAEYEQLSVLSGDVHSSNKVRVHHALANVNARHRAFSCESTPPPCQLFGL